MIWWSKQLDGIEREDYITWEQRCDEFIESLDEHTRIKCIDS